MQRSHPILILRIQICIFSDQQFDNFRVIPISRKMQRSETSLIIHTHIRTFVNKEFGDFPVAITRRTM